MGKPSLLLQIVDENGVVARLHAGGDLEVDLVKHFTDAVIAHLSLAGVSHQTQVDNLTRNITKRNVGFFKTQAKVEASIRDGLSESVSSIDTGLDIEQAVHNAIKGSIKSLKDKTIHAV